MTMQNAASMPSDNDVSDGNVEAWRAELQVIPILGLDLIAGSFDAFTNMLLDRARWGEGGYVITLNLEHVARASRDPAYAELLRSSKILCADGAPIHWASRLASIRPDNYQRIAGVDLVAALLRKGRGLRSAIIGGRDPLRALARLGVNEKQVCYLNCGAIRTDRESLDDLSSTVAEAAPNLIFVGLGVPKQDLVGKALRDAVPDAIIIGVGGSFEILGGMKRRAPPIIQRVGLEWLFRFAQEPRRLFARYFLLYPVALQQLIRWAIFARKASRGAVRPLG